MYLNTQEDSHKVIAGNRPMSEGESALNRLHGHINTLDDLRCRLVDRLDSVIRPRAENQANACGSTQPAPARAPIIEGIENASERLDALIGQFEALIASIGV